MVFPLFCGHCIALLPMLLVSATDTHTQIILRICFYTPTYTSFSICHTKTVKSLFNFLSMPLLYSLGTQPITCTLRYTLTHTHQWCRPQRRQMMGLKWHKGRDNKWGKREPDSDKPTRSDTGREKRMT